MFWEVLITGGKSLKTVVRLSGFMRKVLISDFMQTKILMVMGNRF